MTVNHNSSLRLWVHWLSRSRCGRHIWASFKEVLSSTHAVSLWQHGAQAGPPPGWCVACCICADSCTAVADLPRVTLLIFLGGVCSTQSSLCAALLFFLGSKPSLHVVLLAVATFGLLPFYFFYFFFYQTCISLSVWVTLAGAYL